MLRRTKIALVMVVLAMLVRTPGILAFPSVERVMAYPQCQMVYFRLDVLA
jgi:hypothetical protein